MAVAKATTHSAPKKRILIEKGLYQRNDGKFEASYRSDGRFHIVTLDACAKTEARRARRDLLSKVDKREVSAPSRMTVAEVVASYFEGADELVASDEMSVGRWSYTDSGGGRISSRSWAPRRFSRFNRQRWMRSFAIFGGTASATGRGTGS